VNYPGKKKLSLLIAFTLFFPAVSFPAEPLYMWYASLGDTGMYMLGSIHVLSEDFYPLPDYIEELSRRADVLVLEADVSDESLQSPEIIRKIQETGFCHDGRRIEDFLSDNDYQHLLVTAEGAGLNRYQISLMKPWLLALTLQTLELENLGYCGNLGLEKVIRGLFSGGELLELEGTEYQLELMAGLSEEEQVELLLSVLDDSESLEDSLRLYVRAWKEADPGLIEAELDTRGLSGEITRCFLDRRNENMVDKAVNILRSETRSGEERVILLLAGAAHFVGDSGIPTLMEQQGIHVRQVDSSGGFFFR
jgi:uncharacterized protein YbaP (TraB family)